MADQAERVILEAEETPVLESVGRANTALDSFEKKSESSHGKVIRISDQTRTSVQRLVASLEKQAETYGKSGVDKLISQRDQLLHTTLAVCLGMLFEGGDESLDAGSRLIRNADHLAVGRLGLFLETVERGIGASDRFEYRSLLGFEDYALCLICHFTLP